MKKRASVTINKIINLFFKNLSFQQTIIRNSFWLIIGKFLGGLLRALLVIFSARLLGAEEYGSFSLAMNFVLIFSFLPELGLTSILTKELSQAEKLEDKQKIFNSILLLSLILSLVSYLLIIILGNFFLKDQTAKIILPILSLMLIFDIFREFSYAVYRSQLRGELHSFFHLLTNLLLFTGGLLSLIFFKSSISLAFAYLITIALGFILGNILILNYFKKFKFNLDYHSWLKYFNASWPIAIANALYLLLLFTDSIILGWYFPSYLVGIYNSSIKVSEFLIIFPTGISLAFLPIFSKNLFNQNKLKEVLELGIRLIYLLIIPIIIGSFLLSEKLILFLFGNEYLSSVYAFKILIPSLIATSLFMLFSQLLIALNKRRELLIYEFLIYFLNLIGNLLLIPYFDFIGAAYMTSVSNFLSLLVGFLIVNKYLNFNIFSGIKNSLIASLIMSITILLSINLNFIINIILGLVSYLIVLIFLKDELVIKTLKKFFS
jgi:O-antigen/teichoic acid export membrane protein